MSYTIISHPDAFNLSLLMPDLVLETTTESVITVKVNNTSVLTEKYTPDAANQIIVREIGKLAANYMAGSGFSAALHTALTCTVNIDCTQGKVTTEVGEYVVMLCRAVTSVPASAFAGGEVFMHILSRVKRVLPTSTEYLTVSLTNTNSHKVQVFITTDNYENSDRKDLYVGTTDQIRTLDVSFATIAALFSEVDKDTIIAYRIELPMEIAVYMVDRSPYLSALQFRFRNYFDVPETIAVVGTAVRKGASTFDTGRIGNNDVKFNSERTDSYAVESGRIFTASDVERMREFFDSEDAEVMLAGQWIKVIVTEEQNSTPVRIGGYDSIKFSFTLADKRYVSFISDRAFYAWILEDGTWGDDDMYIDSGSWNDED